MPRFKPIHKGMKLLPVDFDRQIQPGSFEHALCYLVDKELDLAPFHARYNNDEIGASAYDPAVLLKIILLAYSRGVVSSRKIEAACRAWVRQFVPRNPVFCPPPPASTRVSSAISQ